MTNKTAFINTPDAFLLSLLAGGGLYGAARGTKELIKHISPDDKKPEDELEVNLPAYRMKQSSEEVNTGTYLYPILAALAGGAAGFGGASKAYDFVHKKKTDADLADTENQYMNQLTKMQRKVASAETPLTDYFCAGVVEGLSERFKTADMHLFEPNDTVGDGSPFAGFPKAFGDLAVKAQKTPTGATIATLLALSTLGFGGATYALGKGKDNAKEENESRTTLPTRVRINSN